MLVVCTVNAELVGEKTSVVVTYFVLKLWLMIILPLRAVTSSANKDRDGISQVWSDVKLNAEIAHQVYSTSLCNLIHSSITFLNSLKGSRY